MMKILSCLLILVLAQFAYSDELEKVLPEFEIENVLTTVFWFESAEELQEYFDEERLTGYSECEHKPEKNIAYCDLYLVRPKFVDDDATTGTGHEQLHGFFGSYHEPVE